MNNFELDEQATQLSDTHSSYKLARMLVEATELLDNFDRYHDADFEYRQSPFCDEVRTWLQQHLKKVISNTSYADSN